MCPSCQCDPTAYPTLQYKQSKLIVYMCTYCLLKRFYTSSATTNFPAETTTTTTTTTSSSSPSSPPPSSPPPPPSSPPPSSSSSSSHSSPSSSSSSSSLPPPPPPSSSSIGTTAHCGLWPVEQCPFFPICHQLSPSSHSQHLKISSTSTFHLFLGLPLLLVHSSS